jgi:hypothetical protein
MSNCVWVNFDVWSGDYMKYWKIYANQWRLFKRILSLRKCALSGVTGTDWHRERRARIAFQCEALARVSADGQGRSSKRVLIVENKRFKIWWLSSGFCLRVDSPVSAIVSGKHTVSTLEAETGYISPKKEKVFLCEILAFTDVSTQSQNPE